MISRITIVVTHIRGLEAPLTTTYETPRIQTATQKTIVSPFHRIQDNSIAKLSEELEYGFEESIGVIAVWGHSIGHQTATDWLGLLSLERDVRIRRKFTNVASP